MTLIDRLTTPLFNRLGYVKAGDMRSLSAPAPGWLSASYRSFDIPGGQLPETQSELYQRLSWVYIAVSKVAETAAVVALNVKQRVGVELKDIDNHPFELLLQRPNALQSRFEFLRATASYFLLTGNAYWFLNRPNEASEPTEMIVIPSHRVKPVPDGNQYIKGYLYDPGTGQPEIPLEAWEVAHFKTFHPMNPYIGLSPIEALATTAIGDMKMAQWNTNLFAKDNAKVPGALAFADPISDPEWERMKADIRKNHGGTKNEQMMLLRNVGKGGVEWVAMAMSQREMEFLAGRTFNREEIYSTFAPGLASMLAVNATEANAIAGRSTFNEMAVWPQLVAIAEKITNDLLPAYGTDLVAEFDDVRVSDRNMELQEQAAFERTHTIAEVRKKYYGDDPLGDERDELLIAEVGKQNALNSPPQLQPELPNGEADEEQPIRVEKEQVPLLPSGEEEDDSTKAVREELSKWARFALNRVNEGKPHKAADFRSDVLPNAVKAHLAGALDGVTTAEQVRLAFVQAAEWGNYP